MSAFVNAAARQALLVASQSKWLEQQVRSRAFARRATRRFMPGEELADALGAARERASRSMGSVLTKLGENITSPADADAVCAHYLQVVDAVKREALPSALSIKLTHLGLDFGAYEAYERTQRIVAAAAAAAAAASAAAAPGSASSSPSSSSSAASRVWIDMEDTRYTDVTIDIFKLLRAQYDNVGLCVQAYLRRTRSDIDDIVQALPGVASLRLVKGAYREDVRHLVGPSKADATTSYFELGRHMIDLAAAGRCPAPVFGSHDVPLQRALQEHARERALAKTACEIHMLYGIRAADQVQLAREGHAVSTLIAYGSEWYQWYMRRLAERPANVWSVVQSLVERPVATA